MRVRKIQVRNSKTRWAMALGLAWSVVFGLSAPTFAQGSHELRELTVVEASGSKRQITKGDSATKFSLRLSEPVSCPGDSADENYRVQSYMVPASLKPHDIEYNGLGPAPHSFGVFETFRQPLYDITTRPYDSALTEEAESPGEPGAIVNIPTFSFAVYSPGDLPPGTYNVGIACTLNNKAVISWNTRLVFTKSTKDKPAQVKWQIEGADKSSSLKNDNSNSAMGPIAAFVIVVSVALVVVSARSSRRRTKL